MTDTSTDHTTETVDPTIDELWPGDTGALPENTRRVLLRLVRGPYLSGAREGNLWAVLLSDERIIRSRLADLFLDLVIDTTHEFAFTRNAPSETAPRAVRTESLTFIDTAMLLALRQTLLSSEGYDRVIVGKDEIFEQLTPFRTPDRDEKDFTSRLNSSWGKMVNKLRLLHALEDDRAEISPVVRMIVSDDQIRAITGEYERIRTEATGTAEGSVESPEENPVEETQ